jgi:hypothetical protein
MSKITSKTRLQGTTPEDDLAPALEGGNLATIAGAIDGNEMQVDIVSGSSAGEQYADNTVVSAAYKGNLVLGTDGSNYQILKVDSAGDLQVDVLTMPSVAVTGTFWQDTQPVSATNLDIRDIDKASDDILVYANTAKDGSGTSYVPLVDTDGHLQVDVLSGTAAGEQYVDETVVNAAYKGNLVLGTDGSNYQILSVNSDGRLQVDVVSGATAGEQYVDNTAVSAEYKGNIVLGTDGSNYQVVSTDSDGHLQVDVLTAPTVAVTGTFWQATQPVSLASVPSHAVTNAGVFAVQVDAALPAGTNAIGKLAANTGVDIGDVDVLTCGTITPGTGATNLGKAEDTGHTSGDVGVMALAVRDDTLGAFSGYDEDYEPFHTDSNGALWVHPTDTIAHDAADAGNPIKIGFKSVNFNGSAPPNAAAAENDRVNAIADEYGRQYVETTHPNYWSVSADYAEAQTNTSVKAAPGAGLSLYITDILISNGATAGNITLLDGSGGTVKFEIYPAINGGATTNLRTPIKLTANTALCITSTTVTTHSITINGFIAP